MAVNLVKTRNYNNEQRTMNNELSFKTNPIKPNLREAKQRFEVIFEPVEVQDDMNNHQNNKQKSQIKMDTTPFVPAHRPQLFYVFSTDAVVKEAATAAGTFSYT